MNIRSNIILLAAFTALIAVMQSCEKDELHSPGQSDGRIAVSAIVQDEWQSATVPSTSNVPARNGAKIKGYKLYNETSNEPLYIFESVSRKFESSGNDSDSETVEWPSRGVVIKNNNLTSGPLGIYAYFSRRTELPFYMDNVRYNWANGKWHIEEADDYRWPGFTDNDDKLTFFGYSPHSPRDSKGNGLMTMKKDGSNIVMHYKVPDSLADQHDLLVSVPSTKVSPDDPNTVPIELHHVLTSIRFQYASKSMYPGTVKEISISNIVGEGDFDLTSRQWDSSAAKLRTYTFKSATKISESIGDLVEHPSSKSGDLLGSNGITLMMIPQKSADRQGPKPKLTIKFTDAATGQDRSFEKEIDINWVRGTAVVYTITGTNMHTEYTLNVKLKGGALVDAATGESGPTIDGKGRGIYAAGNWNADQSSQPLITVTSYYTVYQLDTDGTHLLEKTAPARWETKFVTFNKENHYWVDNEKYNDITNLKELRNHDEYGFLTTKDSVTTVPFKIKGIASPTAAESTEKDNLRSASSKTNYDLSTCGGTKPRSTANCYIVNGPGTYRIPLVYGNAITDGVTNKTAYEYHGNSSGSNILQTFKRHDNRNITDPWIHRNTDAYGKPLNPTHIKIVRFESINGPNSKPQDNSGRFAITEHPVKEETVTDENGEIKVEKYIEFTVSTNELYPCNAVIAVKDDKETTLWTWHIWITGHKSGSIKLADNCEVMDCVLGQLEPASRTYADRDDIVLEIKQHRHNSTVSQKRYVSFKQNGLTCHDSPHSLLYQFGRMTPMHAFFMRRDCDDKGNPNVIYRHADFRVYSDFSSEAPEYILSSSESPGSVIQNPKTIYWDKTKKWNVYDRAYTNLWNNGTTDNPEKTVYDPCPPGYMVPPSYDFWKNYIIKGNTTYGNDFENHYEDYLQYKVTTTNGSILKIPRAAMITAYSEDGGMVNVSANLRYTALWTGNYVTSETTLQGCSFEIKNEYLKDENGNFLKDNKGNNISDTHKLLNNPALNQVRTHEQFHDVYMVAILPMKINK